MSESFDPLGRHVRTDANCVLAAALSLEPLPKELNFLIYFVVLESQCVVLLLRRLLSSFGLLFLVFLLFFLFSATVCYLLGRWFILERTLLGGDLRSFAFLLGRGCGVVFGRVLDHIA